MNIKSSFHVGIVLLVLAGLVGVGNDKVDGASLNKSTALPNEAVAVGTGEGSTELEAIEEAEADAHDQIGTQSIFIIWEGVSFSGVIPGGYYAEYTIIYVAY